MSTSGRQVVSEPESGTRLEGLLPANFRGDAVLPAQYYDIVGRRRWQDGEYRLAFAVLADAVACYYKYRNARSRKGRLLFEEVKLWMHSHSRNGVFAYRNLCETLGIDPDALAKALESGRALAEPAMREIRVWRGKPRRGMASRNRISTRRRAIAPPEPEAFSLT